MTEVSHVASDPVRRLMALSVPAALASLWLPGCDDSSSKVAQPSATGAQAAAAPNSPNSAASPASVKSASNFLTGDARWYRDQLLDGNARPRLKAAVAPNGFYSPNITRDWKLKGEQRGTLITQTRAMYVMASGYEVSGEPAFRDALVRTADFLLLKCHHPAEPGLWAKEFAPDGKVLDMEVHVYGQMQAIFALAHAYRSTGEKRFLDAALTTWLNVDIRALVSGKRPDYALTGLNVAMHTFEAILALNRASPSRVLLDDLNVIGEHILKYFLNEKEGYFYEHLTEDLKPVPGGEIRVGHNFEMAFLFSRAAAFGLPAKFHEAGSRVVNFAAAHGIHATNGSVPHELTYDRVVRDPLLVFWCHAEALRALAHFVIQRQSAALRPKFDAVLGFVKGHFIDPDFGGWYRIADRPDQGKGSDWFAGYHEAMLCTEILRLTDHRFKSSQEMLL